MRPKKIFLKDIFPTVQILEEVAAPITRTEKLFFDFYLNTVKLVVEVHGQQHYKYNTLFHASAQDFEKKQKFEVSKLDKTEFKGRLISIDENKMILECKGQNQTILKDEIYDLNVRKFSVLKTAGFGVVSYSALVIIALSSLSGFP